MCVAAAMLKMYEMYLSSWLKELDGLRILAP